MSSYEEQIKAVQLNIKFNKSAASVVNELGYPKSTKSVIYWYEEYIANGDLHQAMDCSCSRVDPGHTALNTLKRSCKNNCILQENVSTIEQEC